MNYDHLKQEDPELFDVMLLEEQRQKDGFTLIPSENYASSAVMEALGSTLTNKYSEGYPRQRYYAGNKYIDEIETLTQERVKSVFGVPHVNVQPYSGSPANLAVYVATCQPGDTISGLNLLDGGHLTHGWKVSATAMYYKSVPYHVLPDGRTDIDEVWRIAKEERPKLMWVGATAYVYQYEFEKFAEIAESIGAYLAADISHIAGLVAAGSHPSPVPFAHIITTTTHKSLRGPRGAMIMVTERGLQKDPELATKIDKAVFPGLQGGPHENAIAALGVTMREVVQPEFKIYGEQVVKNAKALAKALLAKGMSLVGGGTETHLLLLDLVPQFGPGGGVFLHEALDVINIVTNKNTIPKDPSSPFYPSGLRIGTPGMTTRGLKEDDMEQIADFIARTVEVIKDTRLPDDKTQRVAFISAFKKQIEQNEELQKIRQEVRVMAERFPMPGVE